ncbi:MAG: hypothetical protein COT81_04985 [Candidatus Buchananbacteria bacterium CG10_big_fil_rev_8_21_14_0_10_42_9]|uniref:Uncharacterized protein n=1 Tax=Candidatus Buchananbacteria bacterium CG10_big_fil_rev_8_21_14_0_10_42_9 TaxID=1974526 RepID=A0A2H0W2J0_9BACT|nr:MAG: hypothetical protein COT81_04985 [Candidatus Buchananbacteria bacterium CG10_big_fil_rev_8_21_14_0_10_42_9]
MNYKKISFAVIGFITILSVSYLVNKVFSGTGVPWIDDEVKLNCIRLRSGNAAVEFTYPDNFLDVSSSSEIRIKRRDPDSPTRPADEQYILGIDPKRYREVDKIVAMAKIEPGPAYRKSSLNEYAAAYFYLADDMGVLEQYEVPFGNRNFYIFFEPTILDDQERYLVNKIIESIKFSKFDEDISESRVENCTK